MIKKVLITITIFIVFVVAGLYQYFAWLNDGRETYWRQSGQISLMIKNNPVFFEKIYLDIFPIALNCSDSGDNCRDKTRYLLDQISVSSKNYPVNGEPSNKHPMYFIKLLPDGKIAKLFFSGELEIKEVDTREERMVVALIQGKRDSLFGPYYDQEITGDGRSPGHAFFDPKPAYLKDLYSQMEVIVPYYFDSEIVGAIVYLHGQ